MAKTTVKCKTMNTKRKNKTIRLLRLVKSTKSKSGDVKEKAIPIVVGERGGVSTATKKSKSRRYLSGVCKRRGTPYFKRSVKRRIKKQNAKKDAKK